MPTPSITSVVRAILTADPTLSADAVIQKARSRGLNAAPASIRHVVHNVRSEIKKVAPAAARQTSKPATPAVAGSAPAADLTAVLANVARVNQIVGLCGGVDNARHLAEAVQACGGVDPFLQHLDLVAGIRAPAV